MSNNHSSLPSTSLNALEGVLSKVDAKHTYGCEYVLLLAKILLGTIIKTYNDMSQFSSVAQLCPTLCDLMNHSTPGLPVNHQLPESTQTHVHRVSDAIQSLIVCHPLLLLPSNIPSIRVFSNESALHIRWPKYFNINLSNEHPGLISFRMD